MTNERRAIFLDVLGQKPLWHLRKAQGPSISISLNPKYGLVTRDTLKPQERIRTWPCASYSTGEIYPGLFLIRLSSMQTWWSNHIPLASPKVREVELLVQLHLATVASSLPWACRSSGSFQWEEQGDLSTQFSDVKQRGFMGSGGSGWCLPLAKPSV